MTFPVITSFNLTLESSQNLGKGETSDNQKKVNLQFIIIEFTVYSSPSSISV